VHVLDSQVSVHEAASVKRDEELGEAREDVCSPGWLGREQRGSRGRRSQVLGDEQRSHGNSQPAPLEEGDGSSRSDPCGEQGAPRTKAPTRRGTAKRIRQAAARARLADLLDDEARPRLFPRCARSHERSLVVLEGPASGCARIFVQRDGGFDLAKIGAVVAQAPESRDREGDGVPERLVHCGHFKTSR
jgi:hypothetical protein